MTKQRGGLRGWRKGGHWREAWGGRDEEDVTRVTRVTCVISVISVIRVTNLESPPGAACWPGFVLPPTRHGTCVTRYTSPVTRQPHDERAWARRGCSDGGGMQEKINLNVWEERAHMDMRACTRWGSVPGIWKLGGGE